MAQKQQTEEEWLKRKLELQKQSEATVGASSTTKKTASTVKLEEYTIRPFKGDYRDWLRFWNQFTVEVDETKISDVSKFHYLLELVKGKPRTTFWVYLIHQMVTGKLRRYMWIDKRYKSSYNYHHSPTKFNS